MKVSERAALSRRRWRQRVAQQQRLSGTVSRTAARFSFSLRPKLAHIHTLSSECYCDNDCGCFLLSNQPPLPLPSSAAFDPAACTRTRPSTTSQAPHLRTSHQRGCGCSSNRRVTNPSFPTLPLSTSSHLTPQPWISCAMRSIIGASARTRRSASHWRGHRCCHTLLPPFSHLPFVAPLCLSRVAAQLPGAVE